MDEICSICSKIFKNKAGLCAHKSAVHGEKNHACDVCDKKFKKKDKLNTHVSTHQDSIDICYACGITFTQKNNWTKHMNIYHLPTTTVMSFLDAFKESGNIVEKKETSKNQHLNKETDLTCDSCKKIFNSQKSLTQHVKVH